MSFTYRMKLYIALGVFLGLLAAVQASSSKPSPYGFLQLKGAVAQEDLSAKSSHVSIQSGSSKKKSHHGTTNHKKIKGQHNPYSRDKQDTPSYESNYGKHHDKSYESYAPDPYYDSHHDKSYESYAPEPYYDSGNHYAPDPYGPYNTPYDHDYWGPRYHAKDQLLDCLKEAVALFILEDDSTWSHAGEKVAHCLIKHLDECADVPELAFELTSALPYALFVNALEAFENDPGSLVAVKTVLGFYLGLGLHYSQNIYYTWDDSCPAKLVSLLQSGAYYSRNTRVMSSLGQAFTMMLEDGYRGYDYLLSACMADIPAVLLAVISTYCPQRWYLYNAVTHERKFCLYNPAATFEDSAGALLGASIISGLILSENYHLNHLGFQLAFDINTLALAATYTSNFHDCPGEIEQFFKFFPVPYSGPYKGNEVMGNNQPSTAAKLVVCAAIAAMAGGEQWTAQTGQGDGENVLWQGAANIYNALFKSIKYMQYDHSADYSYKYGGSYKATIKPEQVTNLCELSKAVYSFDKDGPTSAMGPISVLVPAAVFGSERSAPCYTNNEFIAAGSLNGLPGKNYEGLATYHTLNLAGYSPAAEVCMWNGPPTCTHSNPCTAEDEAAGKVGCV